MLREFHPLRGKWHRWWGIRHWFGCCADSLLMRPAEFGRFSSAMAPDSQQSRVGGHKSAHCFLMEGVDRPGDANLTDSFGHRHRRVPGNVAT
jgi:hypothetical protein